MTDNRVPSDVWRALVDACDAVPCNIHLQERRPDVFVLEREFMRMRECEARLVNVGADWQLEEVSYRDSSRRRSDINDIKHLVGLIHVAVVVLFVVARSAVLYEVLVGLFVSALALPLTFSFATLVYFWDATQYACTWSSMREGLIAQGWQGKESGVWLPPQSRTDGRGEEPAYRSQPRFDATPAAPRSGVRPMPDPIPHDHTYPAP